MSERTTPTTEIGRGIAYAKVADRLKEFHGDNRECSIETDVQFKEGHILFSAKVVCPRGVFTGHSLGKTGKDKQFEKQETIAVGRALAFAGYLSSGEIASFEEMDSAGLTGIETVTLADIHELQRDWKATAADGKTQQELPELFSAFVEQSTGRHFNRSDFRQWTTADLAACSEALEETKGAN